MNGIKLFILTLVLFVYLLLGAVVFHFLEQDNETSVLVNALDLRARFLSNYSCVSEEAVNQFVSALLQAKEHGITITGNSSATQSNWDFSSAFFFSGTVVTTIGYGSIAPKTQAGQLICILYAALGIPLMGWLLTSVATFYQETFKAHITKADTCLQRVIMHQRSRFIFLWFTVAATSYILVVIIPSIAFSRLENWSFHIAHYYSFITLTTIGFGDYIATVHGTAVEHWLYDIFVTLWNILGLAYLAVLISVVRHGEMKTAGSLRKFHAKVIKKKLRSKKNMVTDKENPTFLKALKEKKAADVEAHYKKGDSCESENVIIPCFVKDERRVSKRYIVNVDKGNDSPRITAVVDNLEELDSEEFEKVLSIDGQIEEDEDNMCIMLECEHEGDLEEAEAAIHVAFNTNAVTTTNLAPHGSYSVQNQEQPTIMTSIGIQTDMDSDPL